MRGAGRDSLSVGESRKKQLISVSLLSPVKRKDFGAIDAGNAKPLTYALRSRSLLFMDDPRRYRDDAGHGTLWESIVLQHLRFVREMRR